MSSKFRGKYLQVIPLGEYHLEFDGSGQSMLTGAKISEIVNSFEMLRSLFVGSN